MKNFLHKYNIPTAKYLSSSCEKDIGSFIDDNFKDDDSFLLCTKPVRKA
jgi:phosphoribosylamine-glycine ligase